MIKVMGVQFASAVRIYDFKPGVTKPELNDWVIVDTAQGKEIGRIVYMNKEINPNNEEGVLLIYGIKEQLEKGKE